MRLTLLFLATILFYSVNGQQLFIDNTIPPEEIVMDFFNSDSLTVTNVEVSEQIESIGFFDAAGTGLEVNAGLVFSTGSIFDIPNFASEFVSSQINNEGGDEDIDLATGNMIQNHDNVFIEFDFVSTTDRDFDFNYVFGSEEYPEFVGSQFNDAFLFLVSGPGIGGMYSNNAVNTAMIPNSTLPVAINNVNEGMNAEYYVNNEASPYVVYDGLTTLLPASFSVLANEEYHVKVIIADVGDSAFDSGIFIGYNSLGNPDSLVPPTDFSFLQNGNSIEFINNTKYATAHQWDFGNGEISSEKDPGLISYSTPGDYTVTLSVTNYCCTNVYTETISVSEVSLFLAAEIEQHVLCNGESTGKIVPTANGGNGPYEFTAEPEISDFSAVSAGTYVISVEDQDGQTASMELTITEPEAIVLAGEIFNSDIGLSNGSIEPVVMGGTEPYTYLWSNGAITKDIMDLAPGDYTLEVTDNNNCKESINYTVGEIFAALEVQAVVNQHVSCYNGTDGSAIIVVSGGNAPYMYNITPEVTDLNELAAGDYDFVVTDQDGQAIDGTFTITQPTEIILAGTVVGSTEMENNGIASVDATGGVEPYTYLWSNGEMTKEITDLAPGFYSVVVTDANNCEKITEVEVEMLVGINDEEIFSLQIYPNPAEDFVFVQGFEGKIESILMQDAIGKSHNVQYEIVGADVKISISNLAAGMYFIQLNDTTGNTYSAKLFHQ